MCGLLLHGDTPRPSTLKREGGTEGGGRQMEGTELGGLELVQE